MCWQSEDQYGAELMLDSGFDGWDVSARIPMEDPQPSVIVMQWKWKIEHLSSAAGVTTRTNIFANIDCFCFVYLKTDIMLR